MCLESVTQRHQEALLYLREVHYYCIYCGILYKDAEDLDRSCPGLFEEAHEEQDGLADDLDQGGGGEYTGEYDY